MFSYFGYAVLFVCFRKSDPVMMRRREASSWQLKGGEDDHSAGLEFERTVLGIVCEVRR